MNRVSTFAVAGTLAASLLGSLLASPAALAQPAKAAPAAKPGLVSLLKQGKIEYVASEGEFKIPVTVDGETSMLIARENALGDKDELKVVHVYTSVLDLPPGFKVPAALLRRIAELNDTMLVGKVSIDEKSQCVWFSSSFWLRNADAQTMLVELELAHWTRMSLRKELKPFLSE